MINAKPVLAVALILLSSASVTPVVAGDLTSSLGSLSSLASGDSSALLDAALSKIGLSDEVIGQAKPVIDTTISKGKSIMDNYGYNGKSTDGMSEEAVTKMKEELSSEVATSETSLASMIPAGSMDSVMSLIKSQMSGGLL